MDRHPHPEFMPKQKSKFITCLPLPFFILFLVILGMGMLYLYFFTNSGTDRSFGLAVLFIIMLGVLPWGLFIWFILRFWQVIEFSEKGIKKSFLKKFLKRQILWEELYEIRTFSVLLNGSYVFFSKSNMEGLTYNDAIKRKDQIHILYSKKLHAAIKHFSDKEIINLPAKTEEKNDC